MAEIRTVGSAQTGAQAFRGRDRRRVVLVGFGLVLLLAVLGVLGPREATASAAGGGYQLTVRYGDVLRSSNVAPLRITVRRAGGFGEDPVRLSVGRGMFDHLDFQNWYPNPAAETASDEEVVYEFDPPPGDTLEVVLDARTGPNQFFSRSEYAVAVLAGRRPVVQTTLRVMVVP